MSARSPDIREAAIPTRLLLADVALGVVPALFANGSLRTPDEPVLLVTLILILAFAPLSALLAPGRSFLLGGGARRRAAAIGVLAIGTAGALLLQATSRRGDVVTGYAAPVALATWIAGFILPRAPAYLWRDGTAVVSMVIGLGCREPGAALAVPVFATALLASAALRHPMFAALPGPAPKAFDARRAAGPALLLMVLLGALFFLVSYALRPIASIPGHGRPARPRDAGRSANGDRTGDGCSWVIGPELSIDDPLAPIGDEDVEILSVSIVRSKRADTGGDVPVLDAAHALWKAITYSRFEESDERWGRDKPEGTKPLQPRHGRVDVDVHDAAQGTVFLKVSVSSPCVCGFVMPYVATGLAVPPDGRREPAFFMNVEGDIFPDDKQGPLAAGLTYDLEVQPAPRATVETLARLKAGPSPDPKYLVVPDRRAVGVDFADLARDVFGDATTLGEKLVRLKTYLEKNFVGDEAQGRTSLRRFLFETRAGDCRHFAAAAALLLRRAGVPARLAGGFTGSIYDPDEQCYRVTLASAHSWVEVFADDNQWVPVDPTIWVRVVRGREGLAGSPSNSGQRGASGPDAKPGDAGSADRNPSGGLDSALRAIRTAFGNPRVRLALVILLALVMGAMLLARRRNPKVETPVAGASPLLDAPGSWFEAKTPADRVLVIYARLQRMLSVTKRERRPFETPREHGARVACLAPATELPFGVICGLVYRALYGCEPLADSDTARAEDAARSIVREFG